MELARGPDEGYFFVFDSLDALFRRVGNFLAAFSLSQLRKVGKQLLCACVARAVFSRHTAAAAGLGHTDTDVSVYTYMHHIWLTIRRICNPEPQ